jgi:ubiquitin carboxyl-terminal hydrolase 1
MKSLASVPEFMSYLEAIHDGPETTPVSTALLELLDDLNTFSPSPDTLFPDKVARALMQSDKNRLLATREQQDAQEFFSLLIDTLEIESSKQWLLINKPSGLESITRLNDGITIDTPTVVLPSPFEGLSANRLGCLKCKYVENIRHEKFSEIVLPLSQQHNTTLSDCLAEDFKMETLEDVECLKCTLLAYRTNLSRLISSLSAVPEKSSHLTSVISEASNRLNQIDTALKSGKIEDPKLLSPGSTSEKEIKKFIQRSPKTKTHMIARPPSILAFHIQRSTFHPFTGRAIKSQASVTFPQFLDLSRFVTTHELSMDPEEPISVWREGDKRTEYTLRSVIVHYGLHNMGHYVSYRFTEEGWFRISDEDVERSTWEEVSREGARGVFMLMYQKVEDEDESDGELVQSLSDETVTETTTQSEVVRDLHEKHDFVDVRVDEVPEFKRLSFDQPGRPFVTVTG